MTLAPTRYPWGSSFEAGHAASTMPGPYKVPAFRFEAVSVATNKATIGTYRGVGLPIAVLVKSDSWTLARKSSVLIHGIATPQYDP